MQPEPATALATRRYRLERELGRGGMGIVYQAFDLERGARVALKALTHSDALNIYRLKNEFRQLSDISHPNLVSLHELTFDGEHWFFTMELIDGVSFDSYVSSAPHVQRKSDRALQETIIGRARLLRDPSVTLSQPGIVSPPSLARTGCDLTRLRAALAQLIAAICALHEAGKLHRDIKPSNVLVTEHGRLVVLDFGLVSNSTRVDPDAHDPDRTIGGTVFGTPAYMSPEQATGEPITPASDWYSVGCIVYEALTGRLPFDGTVLQILKQKEELEPARPSEVVSGIPEDLDELCARLLRRKPEARPDAAELRRWFSGSSVPPPLRDSWPENKAELFVGREPHLATLHAAFERARAGSMSVVFVDGYSGMGKSALVRCFANDLIRAGEAVVLRGRCYERESVPYKAFDDIVDSLSRYMMRLPTEEAAELLPRNVHSLARLFPVLNRVRAVLHARKPLHQTSDPHEMRNQAFGALKDLLLRLSDWQPLVINIDDLQWADMDSARLLSYLLGPPDAPPALFVGVYRREEATTSAFVRHVLADPALNSPDTVQMALDPLAPDEAQLMAAQLLHERRHLAPAVARESEGVPFFISELTRHICAQPLDSGEEAASVSLHEVIGARLAGLSPDAVRLMQVLSVAARPLEQGVALEAADLLPSDRTSFQELRAARMVRTRGTRQTDLAETYHDRVRETVLQLLAPERTRELHARLAHASVRWGVGDPEQLVVHYAEAGEGGRAGETAIQAARAAADKLAFDRSADLFRRALTLLPEADKSRRHELLTQLGDALAHAGRGAQSAEAYLQAAAELDEPSARPLKRIAAQQLLASGRFAAGARLTAELLATVNCPYPDTRTKLRFAYAWTRSRLMMRGLGFTQRTGPLPAFLSEQLQTLALFRELHGYDLLGAAWLQARFLLTALDAGDENALLEALSWECFHLSMQGSRRHEKRAEQVLALSRRIAESLGTPYARAKYQTALAVQLLFAKGQYRDAIEAARNAESLLEAHCPGHTWERTWLMSLRYMALEFAGDLGELLHGVPRTARDAADRDDRFTLGLLLQSLPLVHLMQDDPQGAQAFINSQALKLDDGFSSLHFLLMTRSTDVLLYEGKGVEALALVHLHWDRLTRNLLFRTRVSRASAHLVRARAALMAYRETGDSATLQSVVQDSQALRQLGPGFAGFGPAIDAQLALLQGDRPLARRRFEEALRRFSREQSDHAAAYVRYRLGELLQDPAGRSMLQDTREALERQGVVHVERFVRIILPVSARPALS